MKKLRSPDFELQTSPFYLQIFLLYVLARPWLVPARRPVYFQVIDSMGYCIAIIRSWSTLQPDEHFFCLGCHMEIPMCVDPPGRDPKPLETPLGIEGSYFDYGKFVQPIRDKHCVDCHKVNHESGVDLRGDLLWAI